MKTRPYVLVSFPSPRADIPLYHVTGIGMIWRRCLTAFSHEMRPLQLEISHFMMEERSLCWHVLIFSPSPSLEEHATMFCK